MIFIFYLDQVDYDGYCLEYCQGVYKDQTGNIPIDVLQRMYVNSFTKDVQLSDNSTLKELLWYGGEYSPCKTTPEAPISQL